LVEKKKLLRKSGETVLTVGHEGLESKVTFGKINVKNGSLEKARHCSFEEEESEILWMITATALTSSSYQCEPPQSRGGLK